MSRFISTFAPSLDAMSAYREALGFSRKTHENSFIHFDRFCAENYPDSENLTKEMALKWIEEQTAKKGDMILERATAIRLFGKYLTATGNPAYILPKKYVSKSGSQTASPYIFTDAELSSFFHAADRITTEHPDPEIAPVLFRLIYTCGLRPNEGRELKRANINFITGEILITKTKRKKERIIVMSEDMLELCKKYDTRRCIFAKDSEYFFPARNGGAYTTGQLDKLFKKIWTLANPEIDITALPKTRIYDLRHRFASAALNRWLDEKRDLYVMLPYLRAYMGHDKLSDTAYYIHLLPENLKKSAGVDWADFDELIPEVSI